DSLQTSSLFCRGRVLNPPLQLYFPEYHSEHLCNKATGDRIPSIGQRVTLTTRASGEVSNMDSMLKSSVWQQFGAAIDTLDSAINLGTDHLWMAALWKDTEDERYGQFWFIVYHTLFWTDLYLTGSSDGFLPPPPFIRGKLPEIPYTKEQ